MVGPLAARHRRARDPVDRAAARLHRFARPDVSGARDEHGPHSAHHSIRWGSWTTFLNLEFSVQQCLDSGGWNRSSHADIDIDREIVIIIIVIWIKDQQERNSLLFLRNSFSAIFTIALLLRNY